MRACAARSGRSRVSCSAAAALATRPHGLLVVPPLDGHGGLDAVGGARRLRSRPPPALGERDRVVGVAQRPHDLAPEGARRAEMGQGGERGPVAVAFEGARMGTLEVRGRGVEVACPELDDPELAEDEGPHAARPRRRSRGRHRARAARARCAARRPDRRAGALRRGPIAALLAANWTRRSAATSASPSLGAVQIGLRARHGRRERAARRRRRARAPARPRRAPRHRLEDRPQGAHLAVDHHVEPACPGQVGGEVPGAPGGCMA